MQIQSRLALGIGTEIRSFRLMVLRRNPASHSAIACSAVVLPELLGQ